MTTKFGKMVTYLHWLLHIKVYDPSTTQPCDITLTNQNHYISTISVPMATKLGRMVTYLDELLPILSHDPLITWSFEITGQTKIIVSPISQ